MSRGSHSVRSSPRTASRPRASSASGRRSPTPGGLPFQGDSGADLASAVLTESPTALKETTLPGLRGIIQRSMAKEVGQAVRQRRGRPGRPRSDPVGRQRSGAPRDEAARRARVAFGGTVGDPFAVRRPTTASRPGMIDGTRLDRHQPANGTHRRRYGKPHLLSVGSVSSRDMHAASFACSHVRVGARRIKRTGREAAEASGEKIASASDISSKRRDDSCGSRESSSRLRISVAARYTGGLCEGITRQPSNTEILCVRSRDDLRCWRPSRESWC